MGVHEFAKAVFRAWFLGAVAPPDPRFRFTRFCGEHFFQIEGKAKGKR